MNKFSDTVCLNLKHYVYRLIDPRNGETFYVGVGKGNRVYAHVSGSIEEKEEEASVKLQRIRKILSTGLDVIHVIHRHGMDRKVALEVEAALIDAYPGLANIASGHGSNDYGPMHSEEIIQKYEASSVNLRHKALLITINRTADHGSIYEATRYAWKLKKSKAERAEIILAVRFGIIVGAFVAEKWLPATEEYFPGRESISGRFGFIGREADKSIHSAYVGKRLPEKFQKRGAANPVKYSWK